MQTVIPYSYVHTAPIITEYMQRESHMYMRLKGKYQSSVLIGFT